MSNDNVFVLPVAQHGASVVLLLSQFNLSAKHVMEMKDLIVEYGDIHSDNSDFIIGVENFLKKIEHQNIYQAVDFLNEALLKVDRNSYYAQVIVENLLSLSEKIYDLQDFREEKLKLHDKAFRIVQQAFPYTESERLDRSDELPSKDRAIDLLFRYADKTPDFLLSASIMNDIIYSVDDKKRKQIAGHSLYYYCQKIYRQAPLDVLEYLGDAIDVLGEGNPVTLDAIALWQHCAGQLDPEDAISKMLYQREATSSRFFAFALNEDIRTYQSRLKPRNFKPAELKLV